MTQTTATSQYCRIITERPNYIDYAKVIGIFCVLIGHFVYFYEIPFQPESTIWSITHFVTLYHMPLFFMISGMLFHYNPGNFPSFLKKQWSSLMKPYLLYCLIVGGGYYLIKYLGGISLRETLSYCLGIITGGDLFQKSTLFPVGPIWFVYSLFIIKILMVLALEVKKKKYQLLLIAIYMLLGLFVIAVNHDVLPLRLDSSFVGFLFFGFGILLRKRIPQLLQFKAMSWCVFIISLLLLIISYNFNMDNSIRQGLSINVCYFGKIPWIFLLSGLAGTLCVLSFSRIVADCSASKASPVLILSNGMIAVLAIHKILYISFRRIYYTDSLWGMFAISLCVLLISYIVILGVRKYCPILVGNRK